MRNIPVFTGLFTLFLGASSPIGAAQPIESGYSSYDFNHLCTALATYDDKGDADYVEGLDTQGEPVVPADLNDAPKLELERIYIPITVDLAERFGLGFTAGLEADALIGVLQLNEDTLYFNDQKISDTQSHAIATECARQRKTP